MIWNDFIRAVNTRERRTAVDLKQLNALLAVADAGTVTKAARLLHLEQPAVSRQLKLLETELGLSLFDRSRNGMVLTDSGEVLVGYARRAVSELENAEAELRAEKVGTPGDRDGRNPDSVTDLVSEPLVTAIRRASPDLELRLYSAFAGHLRQSPPSNCGRWLQRRPDCARTNLLASVRLPATPRRPGSRECTADLGR